VGGPALGRDSEVRGDMALGHVSAQGAPRGGGAVTRPGRGSCGWRAAWEQGNGGSGTRVVTWAGPGRVGPGMRKKETCPA
jgi:hypothetical protein